jgi:hypothetical protein
MSLSVCDAKLMALTRELSIQWGQVSTEWRDSKRDEFYHNYLAGLFESVGMARSNIVQIDEIISTIRKDCE